MIDYQIKFSGPKGEKKGRATISSVLFCSYAFFAFFYGSKKQELNWDGQLSNEDENHNEKGKRKKIKYNQQYSETDLK